MSLTAEPEESIGAPAAARRRLAMPAEDLAWIGSICGAIVLAIACLAIAPQLAKLYPEPANDVFALWRPTVLPEPLEETRSILALGTPFVIAAVILAFGTPGAPSRSLNRLIVPAQAAVVVLLVAAVLDQPRQSGFLTDYFHPYLLSVPNLVAGVVIGLLLTVATLRWSGRMPDGVAGLTDRLPGSGVIAFGIAVIATVVFLLPAVVTDATVGQAGPIAAGHIPTQAEDYISVVNGRTPLVDYFAQYANLLPLLTEPILKAFDSSLTSVSIALCTLSAIALLSIFGVFREVTRRPWTALALFLPFLALALFPWYDNGPFRDFDANYYGILPGRLLGPFVLAWLCAISIRRRIPPWALFGFAGLVALNNIEFGLPALLAVIAAKAVGAERARPDPRSLARAAGEAVAGLLGAVVIVCAITLLRTGELPDPALLTYFNRLFLRDSFGLEPMPGLGLHWALYATYTAALLLAAVRFVRAHPDRTLTAMLAFAGTFGLGTGMYFVGRSSQFQLLLLFPAWALALALLAWVALHSLREARGRPAVLERLLLPACVALIGFGLMISAIDRVSPPWRQIDRLSASAPGANDDLAAQRYVEAHTRPGEHVLILGTALDHRVADRAGVVNVSPVSGLKALITPAEAQRALDQLEDEGGNLVFESLSGAGGTGGRFPIPELAPILRERGYRLVGVDPDSRLRLWRRAG
ncbi:MAG TPA: hypothetical protein VGE91_01325 [Solirubrobacterales bacterium]|jgi:hypothetical protein